MKEVISGIVRSVYQQGSYPLTVVRLYDYSEDRMEEVVVYFELDKVYEGRNIDIVNEQVGERCFRQRVSVTLEGSGELVRAGEIDDSLAFQYLEMLRERGFIVNPRR
jgi:hypothetical protein